MRKTLCTCTLLLSFIAAPSVLIAQDAADAAQLRAAVLRALRDDSPPVPHVLVFQNAEEADVATRVGALLRIPVALVEGARPATPIGGDTVAVRIRISELTSTSAIATIDSWGRASHRSKHGPTVWFVRQQADVVRVDGLWTVRKIRTLMES
jgi:hypothetical protein